MKKRKRKPPDRNILEKVFQHLPDLRRIVDMFILHELTEIETSFELERDRRRHAPGYSPQKPALARYPCLENTSIIQQQPAPCDNPGQVRQVLKSGDRNNPGLSLTNFYLTDIAF